MKPAQQGDVVGVHYIGTLGDGTTFDSSRDGDPLQFTLGGDRLLPAFEAAVEGMTPGETKTFTIPAEDAYGPYQDDLVLTVARDSIPADIPLDIGEQLEVRFTNGESGVVTIAEVSEQTCTLDANHPLAKEDLTFDIEVVSVS